MAEWGRGMGGKMRDSGARIYWIMQSEKNVNPVAILISLV